MCFNVQADSKFVDVIMNEVDDSLIVLIQFFGDIEVGDAKLVESKVQAILTSNMVSRSYQLRFQVISHGGSVTEAMKLGRYLRREKANVMPVGYCESSCVLLLAGGIHRTVLPMTIPTGERLKPTISVHRPYFEERPSSGDAGLLIKNTLTSVKKYLDEMNIPPGLADLMYSIPPEKKRILTQSELSYYRLNQSDFVYQESLDVEIMEYLGVTRSEYIRFTNELNATCERVEEAQMALCIYSVRKKWGFDFNK
jgi:hypothetical protein